MLQNCVICSKLYNFESIASITSKHSIYAGVVLHSKLIQKDLFHKSFQISTKYCKMIFFAANAITSRVLLEPDNFLKTDLSVSVLHDKPSMHQFPNYTICCKSNHFAAFCSNLIFFQKSNLSESTTHDILSLCTKFRSNHYHLLQIMLFAAFCSNLMIF